MRELQSRIKKKVERDSERYAAIVLAAGLSTRMGRNKLLLKLGDKTVLEWVVCNILKSGFEYKDICIVVSSAMMKNDMAKLSIPKSIKVISNEKSYLGQAISMKLGLKEMIHAKGVFFFLGDQPFIHPEDIIKLKENAMVKKGSIIIPVTENGKRGNPVLFPKEYYDELLMVQGDKGGRAVIDNPLNSVESVNVFKSFIHFDLDTPENYAQAKELLKKWI